MVPPPNTSVSDALATELSALGAKFAFGVIGGGIARLYDSLSRHMALVHTRHESGAAFAACEASLASGAPSVVFTTTGPGLLNAITGMTAARDEGATVILVSGATNARNRGRWATQETSSETMAHHALVGAGSFFDYSVQLEHPAQLPQALARMRNGIARRPAGFTAHIAIPAELQGAPAPPMSRHVEVRHEVQPPQWAIAEACERLATGSCVIWAGFGARSAVDELRRLARHLQSPVMVSPRAKGVFSETDPLYLGVTGIGGHVEVLHSLERLQPAHVLAVGSRLGEPTSFWDPRYVAGNSLVHVDVDPVVPGVAFPTADVLPVIGTARAALSALLRSVPRSRSAPVRPGIELPASQPHAADSLSGVRAREAIAAIQSVVVRHSRAVILAESGNSFAWAAHELRLWDGPRLRISTQVGSMGHMSCGVVGAALVTAAPAVAIVGDGAFLMQNEVSTAAAHRARAIWVVLNDGGYGMCDAGQSWMGLTSSGLDFPRVDAAQIATASGAVGIVVGDEKGLVPALEAALAHPGPTVIDVRVRQRETPTPLRRRFEALRNQNGGSAGAWEQQ